MARKLRIEYPGAIYHLMNRGDRKEAIYWDDSDRELFPLLGTCTGRFNRKHKLSGHLFSGRYKGQMVDGSGSGYLPVRSSCIGILGRVCWRQSTK